MFKEIIRESRRMSQRKDCAQESILFTVLFTVDKVEKWLLSAFSLRGC